MAAVKAEKSKRANTQAEIGIIGGSGLYSMSGLTKTREVYVKTPFGEPSDAIVLGMLEGKRVAFLARHGRGHRILPSEINFRANVYAMKLLGVERIISVSAVGSLMEDLQPGEFLVPDQFVDRTKNRVSTFFGEGLVAHVGFDKPTCGQVSGVLADASVHCGVMVHRRGNIRVHRGAAVFDFGGSEHAPAVAVRSDWDDQCDGSEAGARSGDLLRDDCDDHGL